jgi:hypothetical protein
MVTLRQLYYFWNITQLEIELRNYLALLFILILAGCAAGGEKYREMPSSANAGKSQMVLFRKSQFANGGQCFVVKVDGAEIGTLSNGGYLRAWVTPGPHRVTMRVRVVTRDEIYLDWNAEADGTKFFEYAVSNRGVANGVESHYEISPVSKVYALENLQELHEATNACLHL